jgi:hypothetical protein
MEKARMKNLFAQALVLVGLVSPAFPVEIEPPKIELVDKFGVNIANGQVTHSINTVSIGGAMGLSDRISVYGNEFNFSGGLGFNHKYYAQAKDVQLVPSGSPNYFPHNVMRVFGPEGSADFAYYSNGVMQDNGNFTTTYTYVPLGDERNILEVVGNNLEWTRPDGTILRFDRGAVTPKKAQSGGQLISIEYPNGFIVSITSLGMSVNTNTGFQLKQVFATDTATCPSYPNARSTFASGWSTKNPANVYGINAAVDYCPPTATSCSFTKTWPKAAFSWPHCTPDLMFLTNTQVDVTTAQNITTSYKFTRYDLAYDQNGIVRGGLTPGTQFSPRLASVSAPNNSAVNMLAYTYKNFWFIAGDTNSLYTGGGIDYRIQNAGVATSAQRAGTISTGYDFNRTYMSGPDYDNIGGAPTLGSGIQSARVLGMIQGAVGAIDYADTDAGRVYFEHTPRNLPTIFNKVGAPTESYGYTRGNLSSITYNGSLSTSYYISATFPSSCTPSTRKTCNQATSMRDARGNVTDYEYHSQSGQVSKIKYPANKHGVRPETRFEYQKRCAQYYGTNGAWTTGSEIWVKTAEKYCANSAASGGVCAGGDEVVTQFEYNHKNLLLTGKTVTAQTPNGLKTIRSCYEYDIYGNQIGVTTPNANRASCGNPSLGVCP